MAQSATVEQRASDETPSETIVSAVSDLRGVDPTSMEPLYSVIDPDALDALFGSDRGARDRSPARVTFTYCGCDVVVSGDGSVRVSERADRATTDTHDVRS